VEDVNHSLLHILLMPPHKTVMNFRPGTHTFPMMDICFHCPIANHDPIQLLLTLSHAILTAVAPIPITY